MSARSSFRELVSSLDVKVKVDSATFNVFGEFNRVSLNNRFYIRGLYAMYSISIIDIADEDASPASVYKLVRPTTSR